MPYECSQLQFNRDHEGNKCLVYKEDTVTKTHDGGINDRNLDRKEVWIFPNIDRPERCTVRLVEKYLSLCPNYFKKSNFYLQSLQKPTPKQWYGEQLILKHTIGKVVSDIMETGGIQGFLTNHSLHHSGGTRLFRGGVDRKLIKESTGHRCDVVDEYAKTNLEQRRQMSEVIKGPKVVNFEKKGIEYNTVSEQQERPPATISKCQCTCGNITDKNIGEIISRIVQESGHKGKNCH